MTEKHFFFNVTLLSKLEKSYEFYWSQTNE